MVTRGLIACPVMGAIAATLLKQSQAMGSAVCTFPAAVQHLQHLLHYFITSSPHPSFYRATQAANHSLR
jgi:hypothetical protein